MKRLEKSGLVISLIEHLHKRGSWCGETHIQKSTYFLQELLGVPFEFDYILYKHGPYSFSLSDELTAMRADGLVKLVPQPYPYGPSILPGDVSETIKKIYKKTLKKYEPKINFIAKKLGNKGVSSLEQLSTALYVTLENQSDKDIKSRATKIHELKPHVSYKEALNAVEFVENIYKEVKELGLMSSYL